MAVREEYNTYSAYCILHEIEENEVFRGFSLLRDIKPWIEVLKTIIQSNVSRSQKSLEDSKIKSKACNKSSRLVDQDAGPFQRLQQRFEFAKKIAITSKMSRQGVQRFSKVIGTFIDPIVIMPDAKYVNVSFSISREKCRRFDTKISMTEFILQLYCYEEPDVHKRLKWPTGLGAQLNSFKIPTDPEPGLKKQLNNFYITENHPPTISNFLKVEDNLLTLRFQSTRKVKYVFELRIVALLTRQKATEDILTNNITLDPSWEDADFRSAVFSMTCHISDKQMEIPIKGRNCLHLEVF